MTTVSTEGMETEVAVILGVDTHLDFHVAVAIDHLGRRLGEAVGLRAAAPGGVPG